MKNKLFLITLISYLGIYITMPVLSAISTQAHLVPGQIGIMISLGAFAMLIFAPIWGKVSDKIGRKAVMIIGILGMGTFFILYAILFQCSISASKMISYLVYLLMGTRFLLGIFMTTAPTAANAYMADISAPKDRAKDMSSLGAATGLAMVLGPIIGGILSSSGNLFMPFYLTIIMLIVFGILLIKIIPTKKVKTIKDLNQKQSKTKSKFFSLKLFGWLIAGCSVMFVIVGLQILTSLYAHDNMGYTVAQSAKISSLLFVILGIVLMIAQVLQMKVFNFTAKKMMLIGIPLILIGSILITLSSNITLMAISYVFIGAGAGLGMSALSAGASLSVSESQQGAVAGAVAMTQGIAGIISPLFGSFIYQIGIKLPFYFFAGFAIFAYLFFILTTKNMKKY